MRRVAVFLIVIALLMPSIPGGTGALGDDGLETENVIVVVIDGARYTETFGNATHELIPYMYNYMRPNGTIDTGFYNLGETKTIPSHGSAMAGVYFTLANDGSERPPYPTVFEVYRETMNKNLNDVWIVSGKFKIECVSYSSASGYGFQYRANFRAAVTEYNDTSTWTEIEDVMDTHHPSLMLINLGEVDGDGHSGVWSDYIDAIRASDRIVWDLWSKIQSDPAYKDKTTLIVTNDHGRHTDDWTDHGCSCEGCRHLQFLVMGPDTKVGEELNTGHDLLDLAPTIATLLGFDMTVNHGELMTQIFTSLPTDDEEDDDTTENEGGSDDRLLTDPLTIVALVAIIVAVAILAMAMRKKGGKSPAQAPEAHQPEVVEVKPQ